jgi:type I restriction enzyme S subunit
MNAKTVPFGSIAEFRNGINYVAADIGDVVKVIGVGDFRDRSRLDKFSDLSTVMINGSLAVDDELRDGDLLLVRSNGSRDLVGRSLIIKGPPPGVTFSGFTIRVRVEPSVALPEFVALVLQGSAIKSHLLLAGGGNGNIANLSQSLLRDIELPLPPVNAQRAILGVVSSWDLAIEKTDRLIATKSDQISQARERLVGHSTSKHTRLRDATRESLARNGTALGREQIMGVTNDRGMRPMREETIAASIDRYKIVRPRAFAYNPMRLNVGSIAMSPFDRDVLVSPDYVVFECDESKLLPDYLNHLRRTRHWASFFDVAGSGSVRVRIYYDDLAAFTFPLPSIEEQRRAVAVLDTATTEIDVLTRYADALRRQKRGLMQKLLTGEWQVPVPALETT